MEPVILSETALLVIIALSTTAGALIGSILAASLFTRAPAAESNSSAAGHRELNVDVVARGVGVRADLLVRFPGERL
jgi:hypothetical protein